MKFSEHLQELKFRFFIWLGTFIVASILGFLLYDKVLFWLTEPLKQPLYYTSPVGGFEAVLEVSVFFGFMLSIPVLIFEIIGFLQPIIGHLSYKYMLIVTVTCFSLASIGILVAYYLVVPNTLRFLGEFGGEQLQPIISTSEYFSFILKYLFTFGLIFQLPLFLLLINYISPLSPLSLLKQLRTVILISFIAAAILTPTPDFANQTIMALPIILLYLFSILLVSISFKPPFKRFLHK